MTRQLPPDQATRLVVHHERLDTGDLTIMTPGIKPGGHKLEPT